MKTMVIAPHPDDELLGCGGTLLKRHSQGQEIGWVVMTEMKEEFGWRKSAISERSSEIELVRKGLNIKQKNFYQLRFATSQLDIIPKQNLISSISKIFKEFMPEEIFLPYPGDAHSDHRVTFEVASACTKWFRFNNIKRVLVYETISETDFGIDPTNLTFNPNFFVDISNFIDTKTKLLNLYKSEIGSFPFPRSIETVYSLSKVRGSQSGFRAAEAFMLLNERN